MRSKLTSPPGLSSITKPDAAILILRLNRSPSGVLGRLFWLLQQWPEKYISFFLDSFFPFGYFLANGPTIGHSGAGNLARGCRADSRLAASPSWLESDAALPGIVCGLELAQRRRQAQGHGVSESAAQAPSPRPDPI